MAIKSIPILFLHWLENVTHPRVGAPVYAEHKDEVDIRYRDTRSRADFLRELEDWLTDNDAAQYLFVGAHGDENGIGDLVETGLEWPELAEVLSRHDRGLGLWLGACTSSSAATAWSPVRQESAPARYIIGFPDKVYAADILPVLRRLMQMTSANPLTFIDQEFEELNKIRGTTRVTMHYLVDLDDGTRQYVDVSEFEKLVGKTFRDYLRARGAIEPGGILDEALQAMARSGASK